MLNETIAAVDTLIQEPAPSVVAPANGAVAEQARKQLMAALKASEFIAEEKLDEWLDALALPEDKRTAIVDAVDELDYEEAISELENS